MVVLTKTRSSLRLCHINLNSFTTKRSALLDLAKDFDLDILTLNETKLTPSRTATIPGYTLIRRDHRAVSGGLAIAYKSSLDVRHLPLPDDPHFALMATLNLPRQPPITILTLHTLPFSQEHVDLLAQVVANHPRLVIAADLNCHHQALGDRNTNAPGRLLFQFITESGLCHHITPPTRFPSCEAQVPTSPDKLLTSPTLTRKVLKITSGFDLGSDHIPLIYDLKITSYPYKSDHHDAFEVTDYRNADWESFSHSLNTNLEPLTHQPPPQTPDQVELLNASISSAVLEAKSLAVPVKRVLYTPLRLPPDILALIKAKRRTRRLLLRDPSSPYLHDTYRAQVEHVKMAMRAFRDTRAAEVCEKAESDFSHNPRRFWRLVRHYNNPNTPFTPLLVNDTVVSDSQGISEAFRDHLSTVHSVPMHPDFDDPHFLATDALVQQNQDLFTPLPHIPEDLPDHDLTSPITFQEIDHKRKSLRNSAPGPDGISNLLIKKAPPLLVTLLSTLFTSVLLLGYSPKPWKHAHVILFAKHHKDPRNPNNYRPISLTSTFSKLFEKVLARRIHQHLNTLGLLPSTQTGFRPGVNMYDQLLRVVTCLQTNNSLRSPSILALMDVQKAFDTVWHNGLRAKLLDLQLPPPVLRWISHFIDGRTAQVRFRGTLSTPFILNAGVPQGSAISPLLYIIFVRDVPAPVPRGPTDTSCGLAQFADDTAFWISSRRHDTLIRRMSQTLSNFLSYCNRWRILLNTSKTQLCFFNFNSRRFRKTQSDPIYLNNVRLPLRKTCKYLGVTLDTKLNFLPHLQDAKKRATTRLRALRILNNRNHGCSTLTLSRLYSSMIRPVLTFAHPFHLSAPPRMLSSIAQTERRALRIASHLPPWSRNETAYETHSIPPLDDFLNHLNTAYLNHARNSDILQPFFQPYFTNRPTLTIHHLNNL